jgi:hypothetical protein
MSAPWRRGTLWPLAFWYASWMSAVAVLTGVALWSLYDEAYAVAFLYGSGVGVISFLSIAATVSMLTGRSNVLRLLGMVFFAARYGFAAAALGIPAYMGLWPVGPMLVGLVAVYLAENVVLLPRVVVMSRRRAKRNSGH